MAELKTHNRLVVSLLVAALLALLLLATLQFSWVSQISDAYRERMRASLHTGITRFGDEFDRELALAYLNFQMDAETLRSRDWERYARRYDRWEASSAYPDLIDRVYLVQIYAGRRPNLQRYEPELRRFSSIAWPESFASLQSQLTSVSRDALDLGVMAKLSPIEDALPALVVPLSRVVQLSDDREVAVEANLIFGDDIVISAQQRCLQCRNAQRMPLFAYTIVVLDREYLTSTFIPALAQRHFGAGDTFDYNITIVARDDPSRVIYRTNLRAAAGDPVADEATTILDVRLDAFNSLLASSALGEPSSADDPELSRRLVVGVYGSGANAAASGSESGRWRLILTHREGSLEAAAFALRSRNLVLSFGVLLLLGVSVVMIIVATRRAQRLARQQIAFVATVSHELRTPLAVICSAGENLADGVVREPQQARQYGAVIHGEGRRLAEMVEQVLEFAGAESRQRPYTPTAIDVRAAVERAIVACCPPRDRSSYEFALAIPSDLPPVLADQAALLRALQNLIDNAMKYGGDERWIGITAAVEPGGCAGQVVISVRDRGMGIEPGDMAHIFEPFYRGRAANMAQIRGSGLGLSLVRHIADALGGHLSVESGPGRGSTFTLRLPAAPEPVPEALPSAAD